MQKLWPFYQDIKFFCKKHQNPCLLFFLLTRSHNITKSQILNFFKSFIIFFYFLENRKGDPPRCVCVCGGWKFSENLPIAHRLCGALRVNFQFWNFFHRFKNVWKFSRLFNFFKKNSHQFKKFGRKLTHSAPYMYTRSALGGVLWVSLKKI
jgi:hypothetical protein